MINVLRRLLSSDLALLEGTEIRGSIPLPERVLTEMANQRIAARPGRIKQFDIQVGSDSYLQIGVRASIGPFTRWFRPEMIVSADSPVIYFKLASPEYAGLMWLAELFARELLPKGVRIEGRQIRLDLRDVPQLAPYRNLLAHLRSLEVSSTRGTLVAGFDFRIKEPK